MKYLFSILFLISFKSYSFYAFPGLAVPDTTSANLTVGEKLAGAVQFKTVSSVENDKVAFSEFTSLHKYLEYTFPRLHEQLRKEVINDYSLLYTWRGSNQELSPVLLSAHLDVVPVEEASEEDWQVSPFEGVIKDGAVWGRGTMDDKYRVITIMEAVEQLLHNGYEPERTVYLAFGHDEEVGGEEGAGMIAAYLESQGVLLEAVYDEGMAVVENALPGLKEPIALVGVAAKGGLSLELIAQGEGGHSSMPPNETPIDILSNALTRLHKKPFKARMMPTTRQTMNMLAGKLGGKYKFALRHYGFFKRKILKKLASDQATDALIRTQMAPTIINAGNASNVIPRVASAVVNFRILTGETDESIIRHVRRAIKDDRIEIKIHGGYTPPSPVASTESWIYAALEKTIHQTYKGITIVPALFPGGTDAKHYTALTDNIYRFAPQVVNPGNAKLIHNVDEHITLEVLDNSVSFYKMLLLNTCGNEEDEMLVQKN
ncbi:M20/M25/M40 family metallo-hydrolase [Pontibacter harenae]|uniref:M20/M25/M40 family metallo-hydrolase n=1 Tax=Pontibacter harenae TaxID=2894083 RepID=UPI001E56C36B|nr:M20/M25/M40 family metallo-hydrolase [Pontibacter harenae]MCC9167392.1 M20/M25/M40 family metallo-hydrolase [Pontibacter harenae]